MIENKKVLHVVTISFVIKHFFGDQFKYLHNKTGNNYYLVCSPSKDLQDWSTDLQYTPHPINIVRKINPFTDVISIYRLAKYIKKEKFDYVIAHTPKGGMVGMIAAWLANTKNRIYFRHGIAYETSSGLKRFLLKNIEKLSGFLADKVVNVSMGVEQFAINDDLNDPFKNVILGRGTCNGIDTLGRFNPNKFVKSEVDSLRESLSITNVDFIIGYVGRLVHDKGIDELIEAWGNLKTKENIKLLLVGPFEEKDSVNENTRNTIFNDPNIIWTDYVKDASIYFNLMNVFILPTYREGFPTVSLEASSMQLPVIITRATGCEEAIVDQETGIFINNNSEDIVNAVEFYYNDKDVCIEHGINGRKFVLNNFEQSLVWEIIHKNLGY